MRITDRYLDEQKYLHTTHSKAHKYGSGGPQWWQKIYELYHRHGCASILDYGCGKGLLAGALWKMAPIQLYDPAVPKFSAEPQPADLVVCFDVLEHVEPECLYDVLQHLTGLVVKVLFITVSFKRAGRILRDGRNAHLIIRNPQWWTEQFAQFGFSVIETVEPREGILEWCAILKRDAATVVQTAAE